MTSGLPGGFLEVGTAGTTSSIVSIVTAREIFLKAMIILLRCRGACIMRKVGSQLTDNSSVNCNSYRNLCKHQSTQDSLLTINLWGTFCLMYVQYITNLLYYDYPESLIKLMLGRGIFAPQLWQ